MMEYRSFYSERDPADHGRSAHGNGSFRKVFLMDGDQLAPGSLI